jgi:hypothetical protein
MNARIEAELALLRQHFRQIDYLSAGGMHWFQVHALRTPDDWSPAEIRAAFAVTEGHPGAEPYGFFVPKDLAKGGKPPSEHPAPNQPPFDGDWRFLSWNPVGWQAAADVATGSNLWGWVRSFPHRLREGV